jgi:hypothetical protein
MDDSDPHQTGQMGVPHGRLCRLDSFIRHDKMDGTLGVEEHEPGGRAYGGDRRGAMSLQYAVGIRLGNRSDQMTVEAEDALIAALKVKTAHPGAAITYVRKRNVRGDRRHPHAGSIADDPPGRG